MLAIISISVYFIFNLLVTFTNRSIIISTSSPYLLTAAHAAASYISATILARWQNGRLLLLGRSTMLNPRLMLFSILFTVNITLSNYTLSLVSLPVHQTIRATAPALTIVIAVLLELRTWSSFSRATYASLIPIIFGVVLAAHGGHYDATVFGLLMTFVGAVAAVLKTIATNIMQTHFDISSTDLIRHTAPLAVIQSLVMAWHYDEFTQITHLPRLRTLANGTAWDRLSMGSLGALMVVNALLAAALNLASFEANRTCGPLSMGVAANLKQVVILLLPLVRNGRSGKGTRWSVLMGGLMTVVGGMYYAFVQATEARKQAQLARDREPVERRGRAGNMV